MKTLEVDLGTRSYPIFIGQGLLGQAERVKPYIKGEKVFIVTNETIAPLYLESALTAFSEYETIYTILPDGEKYKNLTFLNQIFDDLLLNHFDRHTTLVALGGGVIGDMTGFAAACYQRGVPFIQVPTTLLAQVDSSVGGKTGVNHKLGKNMIGAFHQPQCVVIDTNTLTTLDDRQFSAGLAEVVKYGLINDAEFFTWLEENVEALLARNPEKLAYAIQRCCQDKADIVAQDERESGVRALLNLGHTFGHAIETGMGYGVCLHGEGVAIGMVLAADLSARLGLLAQEEVTRIQNLLEKMRLPTHIPEQLSGERIQALMKVDKKALNGCIRLILLQGIGQAFMTDNYTNEALEATLAAAYNKKGMAE